MKIRAHVYYYGQVQGVGFRFAAEGLAAAGAITGWVKNLRDGGVELVAEGEKIAVHEFLGKIKLRMGRYINDLKIQEKEATGEFNTFEIAF